jgi:hypothetical protein
MIQDFDRDSVSLRMRARPEDVYAIVADVTRTPELSPEIVKVEWLDGATGPAVGARFRAWNKMPRRPAFPNKPIVTEAEPGRVFAFARTEPFGGTVAWRYELEPDGDGTLVTESYEVTKPIGRIGWFIIGTLAGRKDRRSDLRTGMTETLERLRALAEGESTRRGTPEPASAPAHDV